jgi:hypothetical protein
VYSQLNYADGNGTIISIENIENSTRILRKHIASAQIGNILNINYFRITDFNLYRNPEINENDIIDELKLGDNIDIMQILEISDENYYYVWLNIQKNNNNGWFFLGKCNLREAVYRVPYYNNRWEILEYININNKTWTVRNLNNQQVSVWRIINIYDNPGIVNANIISQIIPPNNNNPMIMLDVIAATEEMYIINDETIHLYNRTDRWLKVNHNGIVGWIFGGYASVERGGLKYYIPDYMINLCLTNRR